MISPAKAYCPSIQKGKAMSTEKNKFDEINELKSAMTERETMLDVLRYQKKEIESAKPQAFAAASTTPAEKHSRIVAPPESPSPDPAKETPNVY